MANKYHARSRENIEIVIAILDHDASLNIFRLDERLIQSLTSSLILFHTGWRFSIASV